MYNLGFRAQNTIDAPDYMTSETKFLLICKNGTISPAVSPIGSTHQRANPYSHYNDFDEYGDFYGYGGHRMQSNTWPSADQLGFNDSQYEAFKMALTKEFVIIQGPPGTGKTFVGLKIVETLLYNLYNVPSKDQEENITSGQLRFSMLALH